MENLLVGTLILGLVFACCGTSDFAAYADCGVDGYYCLESAAINDCSLAKSLLADDIPMEARVTGRYDSSSCYLEIRTLSKSETEELFRSEGADEATIQMFESMYGDYYSNIADKKANCVVPATSVEEFLSYGEWEDYCTGELIDSFQYY